MLSVLCARVAAGVNRAMDSAERVKLAATRFFIGEFSLGEMDASLGDSL
jgi:hypothetical protein